MEFKIKMNGQTLRIRKMGADEIITSKTIQAFGEWQTVEQMQMEARWAPSLCVGERVGEHSSRTYAEVLSKFY